jgi:Ser-tRNA(Ala) deacylase AlaX
LDQAGLSSLHTTLVKNKTDIKILAAKRDQYYKELFSIKVGEMENRLVRFSLEVYIDKDNIKQEIGDLKQVIKENVTLDNLAISEETLKTLILISSAYNAQSKSLTKHKLLSIQKKYMELKGNVP